MAVRTWNAGTVGVWFDVDNWTTEPPPDSVPVTGDTVIIGSGTSTINAGDPSILGEAILLGGLAVGSSVTLEAISATFDDTTTSTGRVNTSITVAGGEPTSSPLNAIFLIEGSTPFDGQIFVEAIGGSLTIDAQSDGSNPGNFTVLNSDGKAVVLVTQESFLTFTGQTITNGGLIQVEGGAEIDLGVVFTGTGVVVLDNGGVLLVEVRSAPGSRSVLPTAPDELCSPTPRGSRA